MNLNDSNELVTKTKNIFDTCVKNCHQFTLELMTVTGKIRAKLLLSLTICLIKIPNLESADINQYFEFKNDKILHCTSKFYGKNRILDNYLKNGIVSLSNGKVFKLKISGFCISKSTIGELLIFNY